MTDSFERFHALAGDFGVRLCFAETFARRIECDESRVSKRLEIRKPSLGAGDTFGNYDEESAGMGVRERSNG